MYRIVDNIYMISYKALYLVRDCGGVKANNNLELIVIFQSEVLKNAE